MAGSQNISSNSQWRINVIPYQDRYTPVKPNWGAVAGALLFVGGIIAGFYINMFFYFAGLGLLIALCSLLFKGRMIRKNWKRVSARCIDKEWKSEMSQVASLNGGRKKVWNFRLLCEFELEGQKYSVTPDYWTNFSSENRVRQFLDKTISDDGYCPLWVNPKNPLQTELIGNYVKELLLH